jgi:HAD superfamily hydrolase (TIGR01509 family)
VPDPFFTHMAGFFALTMEELLRRKHPTTWVRIELSELDAHGFFEQFFADGTPIDGPAFKAHVREAYVWIDGIEALLHDLKESGVEMHALSNYPPWYQLIEERLGLSRYVELSFFSCDTRLRKPAAEAYLGACRALGRNPEECLFIDDRAQNTDAARAAGLRALQFTGDVGALRASLRDLGFLRA